MNEHNKSDTKHLSKWACPLLKIQVALKSWGEHVKYFEQLGKKDQNSQWKENISESRGLPQTYLHSVFCDSGSSLFCIHSDTSQVYWYTALLGTHLAGHTHLDLLIHSNMLFSKNDQSKLLWCTMVKYLAPYIILLIQYV